MKNLLFRVKTHRNKQLDDDEFVAECMNPLLEKYPGIEGYQFERVNEAEINLLIWGEL